jgi:hypothetical protein
MSMVTGRFHGKSLKQSCFARAQILKKAGATIATTSHYITTEQPTLAIAFYGSNRNLYNIRVLTIYKISSVCISSALDFVSRIGGNECPAPASKCADQARYNRVGVSINGRSRLWQSQGCNEL